MSDGEESTRAGLEPVWLPGDVDASWLTTVLRRAGVLRHGSVVGFDAAPVGTGQMADSFRFHLRYDAANADEARPRSVVGKFTAADPRS